MTKTCPLCKGLSRLLSRGDLTLQHPLCRVIVRYMARARKQSKPNLFPTTPFLGAK